MNSSKFDLLMIWKIIVKIYFPQRKAEKIVYMTNCQKQIYNI